MAAGWSPVRQEDAGLSSAARLAGLFAFTSQWARRPSTHSAESLLQKADECAWNNYKLRLIRPIGEPNMFLSKEGQGHALYAHINQCPLLKETRTWPV